ncbi:MAG TPA: molybdopterin-dependent oxidoreductase [Spirochaetota bacterium]|nr:molybdopterin-dependent oxidoreductase [Spirochaetota bacterium]HPV98398.1 molybdopterin-dependent oxidoreductase [Spirochaetota bacterium]
MNQKPGVCTFCGTGCGHFIGVENNRIARVYPSQNHPVSKGRLCVRGWNIHELLDTPDRIKKPLIRSDGPFAEASCDEAVGRLIDSLKKYPPESIGFLASPRSSNEEQYLLMKLARSVFGTNNICLDSESGHRASLNVLHAGTGMAGMLGSIEEIRGAEFILVAGIDITRQNPIIGSEIHMAARAGAMVVTMDSRRTQIARLSKKFLQVRPGANKLAVLALAKTIYEENLHDPSFLEAHTEGFEGFRRAFGKLSENELYEKTGLKADEIKTVARHLARAKSAMVFFSSGISGLDEDTIGYIYNLFLLAGKIGKEGCGVNPIAGLNNLQGGYDMGLAPDLLTGFQPLADAATAKKFEKEWGTALPSSPGKPIYRSLADQASELKALVVVDHDEGIVRYADAIKKLDFVAYIGAFKNPFAEYAHVVLPIATYVQEDATFTNAERRIQLSTKKIEPEDGLLPGWKLYSMIAAKAGRTWKYAKVSEVMDEIARLTPAYAGVTHAKLAGGFGLQWPVDDKNPGGTRRFDLAKAGRKLAFYGVSDVFEAPSADDRFPFLLMVGKAQHFWHQNNLMKKTHIPMREYNATLMDYPEGYVEICPQSAKEIGVRDRWPVRVVSPHGEMRVSARVSDDVSPNTAYAPYFVQEMISRFLLGHTEVLRQGEDATIPVRIEKV